MFTIYQIMIGWLKMELKTIKKNWITFVLMAGLIVLQVTITGCPPKTRSLLFEDQLVTGPELQIELDTIIAKAELRFTDLDKQQQLRDIITKNALVMIEGGAINPTGLITGALAVIGLATAGKKTVQAVKNKINHTA